MEKEYDFEDLLKDRLFDAAMQPELRSFDAIMYRLRKERRRKFLWVFFTGSSLIVLLSWSTWRFGILHTGAEPFVATTVKGHVKHGLPHTAGELKTEALHQKNPSHIKRSSVENTTEKKSFRTDVHSATAVPEGNIIQRSKLLPAQLADLWPRGEMPVSPGAAQSENSTVATGELLQPETLILVKSLLAHETSAAIRVGVETGSTLSERHFFRRRFYAGPFVNAVFEKTLGDAPLTGFTPGSNSAFHFVPAYGLQGGLDLSCRWQIFLRFGTLTRQVDLPANPVVLYSNLSPTPVTIPQTEFSYKTYGLEMSRVMGAMRYSVVRLGLVAEIQMLRQDDHTNSQLKTQFLSVGIKAGFVEDLGRHLQFRLSPNIYYCVTGLNQYGSRLRPLAAGVEGTLLLKINP